MDLNKKRDLAKSVDSLEDLMKDNDKINDIYNDSIDALKTYDRDAILEKAIDLADKGDLEEASKLLEFLVVWDDNIREDYAYKLSLWKQDLSM